MNTTKSKTFYWADGVSPAHQARAFIDHLGLERGQVIMDQGEFGAACVTVFYTEEREDPKPTKENGGGIK
ncbi:MAG: hypothetical protein AAB343_02580 [Patescibacteria group bacterium]